jgi:adenylate cyclase
MTIMVKIIGEHNGIVDKFIGDAIMAVWGVPESKGNDALNAVNATIEMRRALLEFNKGRGSAKKPIIKIGCGLNTGAVLAGPDWFRRPSGLYRHRRCCEPGFARRNTQ